VKVGLGNCERFLNFVLRRRAVVRAPARKAQSKGQPRRITTSWGETDDKDNIRETLQMALIDRRFVPPAIHRRALLLASSWGCQSRLRRRAEVECEPNPVTGGPSLLTDNGAILTAGRRCALKAGPYRIPLPSSPWPSVQAWLSSWVDAIMR
jgi:hypothetical protein